MFAASVVCVGVPTFKILFPPTSTVCEPATVKPPSKSADAPNVGVPVTVIVSPDALPKVIFPFKLLHLLLLSCLRKLQH